MVVDVYSEADWLAFRLAEYERPGSFGNCAHIAVQNLCRLASKPTPTVERLRSLNPHSFVFPPQVKAMLEGLGFFTGRTFHCEIPPGKTMAEVIGPMMRAGYQFILFHQSLQIIDPYSARAMFDDPELEGLHAASRHACVPYACGDDFLAVLTGVPAQPVTRLPMRLIPGDGLAPLFDEHTTHYEFGFFRQFVAVAPAGPVDLPFDPPYTRAWDDKRIVQPDCPCSDCTDYHRELSLKGD
jgi:hypothetical protein